MTLPGAITDAVTEADDIVYIPGKRAAGAAFIAAVEEITAAFPRLPAGSLRR